MTRNNSPLAPESDSGAPPVGGCLSYGEDEDRFEVEFYQKSPLRRCFCIFLYFITGGLFFLLLHWMPKLWSKMNLRLVFISPPTHFIKSTNYDSFLKTKKTNWSKKCHNCYNTISGGILGRRGPFHSLLNYQRAFWLADEWKIWPMGNFNYCVWI